jgi:hypothetical protein
MQLQEVLFALLLEAYTRHELGSFKRYYLEDGGDTFLRNVGSNYSHAVKSPRDIYHPQSMFFV